MVPNTTYYGFFKSHQFDFICFSLKLGLIVLVISNQPRAMRLSNLKLLAQLQPLSHPFSNHSWSLQSVWLSPVYFIFYQIASFYALNDIFSPALLKHDDQSNFKVCSKKSIKLQENDTFATFYKPARCTVLIKYLNRMKITLYCLAEFFYFKKDVINY